MRLWSVHPKYLDRAGLVALWRESLLAQRVLKGKTIGYKNHPQLKRFRRHPQSRRAIGKYLHEVWKESKERGYNFDKTKIEAEGPTKKIPVMSGQLRYEFELLRAKLKRRSVKRYHNLPSAGKIEPHPLFRVVEGETEEWENVKHGVSGSGCTDASLSTNPGDLR
jgi:hypothetical protein